MELEKALDVYLNRGFGSMNKNDFEVFIFSQLLDKRFLGYNDYKISIELKIPISKIKRLRYEASLKYPTQTDFKTLFVEAMRGARYGNEKNKVVEFSIENISLRQFLRNMLMQDGRFFDSSFNSEIVKISYKDFLYLLEKVCMDKKEEENIQNIINKNSDKDIPHYIAMAVSAIAKGIGGAALEKIVDVSIEELIPLIKSLFNDTNK